MLQATPTEPCFRVFFGHQSVGADIVKGIAALSDPGQPADSLLVIGKSILLEHARIGQNRDPHSKIRGFSELVLGSAGRYDLVLMKFCYVVIDTTAAVVPVFDAYRAMVERLAAALPAVTVGHVTVPLRTSPAGLRARILRLLGIAPAIRANAARHRFNAMLLQACGAGGLVFDLAGLQARDPSGRIATDRLEDRRVPALRGCYTDDGGHFNELGRRLAADAFVRFLQGARRASHPGRRRPATRPSVAPVASRRKWCRTVPSASDSCRAIARFGSPFAASVLIVMRISRSVIAMPASDTGRQQARLLARPESA